MSGRLYRGRWFIALYDDEDQIVLVADNAKELGALIGIPKEQATRMMGGLFPGGEASHEPHCRVWGRRCTAYFYDPIGGAIRCSAGEGPMGRIRMGGGKKGLRIRGVEEDGD